MGILGGCTRGLEMMKFGSPLVIQNDLLLHNFTRNFSVAFPFHLTPSYLEFYTPRTPFPMQYSKPIEQPNWPVHGPETFLSKVN